MISIKVHPDWFIPNFAHMGGPKKRRILGMGYKAQKQIKEMVDTILTPKNELNLIINHLPRLKDRLKSKIIHYTLADFELDSLLRDLIFRMRVRGPSIGG